MPIRSKPRLDGVGQMPLHVSFVSRVRLGLGHAAKRRNVIVSGRVKKSPDGGIPEIIIGRRCLVE